MSDKSICVFTNFWDANAVIDSHFLLLHDKKNEKLLRINLLENSPDTSQNFSTNSIALSHPERSRQLNIPMERIDCLCPTYDMLTKYKKDKDWEAYQKHFIELIKKRKVVIRDWVNSLKPDWVYFLCCWENTSHGAHCHREILYKVFSESATISKKIIPIYRSGEKIYRKEGNLDMPFLIGSGILGDGVDLPLNWGRIRESQPIGFPLGPITTSTSNNVGFESYQYIVMDNGITRINPRTASITDGYPRTANGPSGLENIRSVQDRYVPRRPVRSNNNRNNDDPPDDPPDELPF